MSMSDFLYQDSISRKEFWYPHGQDKRTILLNNIFSRIVMGDVKRPDSFVGQFKCEIPDKKYNFTMSVPNRYNNPDILWEITYTLVEQAMKWLDLSEIDNFEIKVDDGGVVNKCTYYDLVFWGLKRNSSPLMTPVIYSETKLKKINDWGNEKFERERKEWENKYAPKHDETITIKRPTNLIKKFFKF